MPRPHAGVQCLCGLFVEQLRTGASTAPPRRRQSAARAARRTHRGETPAQRGAGPSTPRARRGCRASRSTTRAGRSCVGGPARGMATDASVARLQTSRTAAHLRRRHAGQSLTTTDAPTRARTPTLTLHHFFGGRLKTLPLRPCCCAVARSLQPLRSDGCASS
jgi:hypothetical protein